MRSPGRNPSRSPASTAGRVRMMRSTCLSWSACTAHGDGEPRLSGTGGADAERDDVGGDRVDIALLTARLRPDLAAAGPTQDVLGEDLTGTFVVVDHADDAAAGSVRRFVAALQQPDDLLEQPSHLVRLLAAHRDLVAAHVDLGARERLLDLAEVLVAWTDERRHAVRAGDDDGGRGLGRRHEVPEQSVLTGRRLTRAPVAPTGILGLEMILILCTGNATRSVIAGAVLAAHVPDVEIVTSGTLSIDGLPIELANPRRLRGRRRRAAAAPQPPGIARRPRPGDARHWPRARACRVGAPRTSVGGGTHGHVETTGARSVRRRPAARRACRRTRPRQCRAGAVGGGRGPGRRRGRGVHRLRPGGRRSRRRPRRSPPAGRRRVVGRENRRAGCRWRTTSTCSWHPCPKRCSRRPTCNRARSWSTSAAAPAQRQAPGRRPRRPDRIRRRRRRGTGDERRRQHPDHRTSSGCAPTPRPGSRADATADV